MSTNEEKPSMLVATAMKLQPSLPHEPSSASYWQHTTESSPLRNCNNDAKLPGHAKYVIIGSGLSGALCALKLLEVGALGQDIVILEARSAASGSTSRNAGHVRPDAFRGFTAYAAIHGNEEAIKIFETEKQVLSSLSAFIAEYNIACDFCERPTLDVNLSEDAAADEAQNVKAYIAAGGSMTGITHLDAAAASQRTGIHDLIDAYEWNAASIHPSKLTDWILEEAVNNGVALYTHCPATAITKAENGDEENRWSVGTPKGPVSACKVIHCTNAYAANLLPQLAGANMVPICVQAHSFRPEVAEGCHLDATMALRHGAQNFYALAQLPADGTVILGIGRPTAVTFADGPAEEELVKEATDAYTSLSLPMTSSDITMTSAWTGLIAFTPDKVPYVGELDDLAGQFICAGFNGHGMANIYACASGVAALAAGKKTWDELGLPDCYRYRTSRLKAL